MFKGILLKVSNKYRSIKKVYETGKKVILDEYFKDTKIKSGNEINKQPHRCDVINFLIENVKKENTIYLEIGVRDPTENFDKINSSEFLGFFILIFFLSIKFIKSFLDLNFLLKKCSNVFILIGNGYFFLFIIDLTIYFPFIHLVNLDKYLYVFLFLNLK